MNAERFVEGMDRNFMAPKQKPTKEKSKPITTPKQEKKRRPKS